MSHLVLTELIILIIIIIVVIIITVITVIVIVIVTKMLLVANNDGKSCAPRARPVALSLVLPWSCTPSRKGVYASSLLA